MKLLAILVFFPYFTSGQQIEDSTRQMEKMADSMHFPQPFAFRMVDTSSLPRTVLYARCYQWMKIALDSLKNQLPVQDPGHGKLTISDIAASTDISNRITITISKEHYTCTLDHYIFHTVNIRQLPIEHAAAMKAYKVNANIQRVLIMNNHMLIFSSLKNFVHRP